MLQDVRPAPPQVQEAVRQALVDRGCPAAAAAAHAAQVTWELHDDGEHYQLAGLLVSAECPEAAEDLARELIDGNAEAHDRTARGETGWEPLWPLPGRRERRRESTRHLGVGPAGDVQLNQAPQAADPAV